MVTCVGSEIRSMAAAFGLEAEARTMHFFVPVFELVEIAMKVTTVTFIREAPVAEQPAVPRVLLHELACILSSRLSSSSSVLW